MQQYLPQNNNHNYLGYQQPTLPQTYYTYPNNNTFYISNKNNNNVQAINYDNYGIPYANNAIPRPTTNNNLLENMNPYYGVKVNKLNNNTITIPKIDPNNNIYNNIYFK